MAVTESTFQFVYNPENFTILIQTGDSEVQLIMMPQMAVKFLMEMREAVKDLKAE